MEIDENQPIVFAYFKEGKLMGYRADTFNTLTDKHPKIYNFSRKQVDVVLENVKEGCNKVGTSLVKILNLAGKSLVSTDGTPVDGNELAAHMSKIEKLFQEWGEFELRVLPFISREEWYELGEGDKWKRQQILSNPQPAIEVHKLKIIDNPN